jgi:hypothetical protein
LAAFNSDEIRRDRATDREKLMAFWKSARRPQTPSLMRYRGCTCAALPWAARHLD